MLIRSFRKMAERYSNESHFVPSTLTPFSGEIVLETGQTDSVICTTAQWPTSIGLRIALIATPIDKPDCILTRLYADHTQKNIAVYNEKSYCSQINLHYENSGFYTDDSGEKHEFFGTEFGSYKLQLDSDNIFTKDFATLNNNIVETVSDHGILMADGRIASCCLHPYGGFFEYGCHPHQMEPYIFHVQSSQNNLVLKLHRLSAIKDFCPTEDTIQPDRRIICGVKSLSPNQCLSLYEEIIAGNCTISLSNSDDTRAYNSNAISHIPGTNMALVNFIMKG